MIIASNMKKLLDSRNVIYKYIEIKRKLPEAPIDNRFLSLLFKSSSPPYFTKSIFYHTLFSTFYL